MKQIILGFLVISFLTSVCLGADDGLIQQKIDTLTREGVQLQNTESNYERNLKLIKTRLAEVKGAISELKSLLIPVVKIKAEDLMNATIVREK